jgi:hypothetical protein
MTECLHAQGIEIKIRIKITIKTQRASNASPLRLNA